MDRNIYILGAGFNQIVSDWDGLKPPMSKNFFQTILRSRKYSEEFYLSKVKNVFDYIEKNWGKTKNDLLKQEFNLEDVFTKLQSELRLELQKKRTKKDIVNELFLTNFRLEMMLAEFLSEFEIHSVRDKTGLLKEFGKKVLNENAIVITFNYDCILEEAIESASGVNVNAPNSYLNPEGPFQNKEVPEEELPYSHHNWNRPLGYGIKFDEIQLQRAGISTFEKGGRFYGHHKNKLYDSRILKLHGSLNWFQYWPIRKFPIFPGQPDKLSPEKMQEIILVDGHWHFNDPPDINGWIINPLIITPVLYKNEFYQNQPFIELWKQAKNYLSECDKLTIIGYSFSKTDTSILRLLRSVFNQHQLRELVVVTRHKEIANIAQKITNFSKPATRYNDTEKFLKTLKN